jgi:hypothetical protein
MIDFMKEYKNQIESARAEIQALQEEQNQIFDRLFSDVGVNEVWLWDYCFNCPITDKIDDYTQRVRNEIYGEE